MEECETKLLPINKEEEPCAPSHNETISFRLQVHMGVSQLSTL